MYTSVSVSGILSLYNNCGILSLPNKDEIGPDAHARNVRDDTASQEERDEHISDIIFNPKKGYYKEMCGLKRKLKSGF